MVAKARRGRIARPRVRWAARPGPECRASEQRCARQGGAAVSTPVCPYCNRRVPFGAEHVCGDKALPPVELMLVPARAAVAAVDELARAAAQLVFAAPPSPERTAVIAALGKLRQSGGFP